MEENVTIAQRILEISADIPLLVMRFIPFHGADTALEPSAIAAEDLISACRKYLPFVYLFNTPSTRYLNTYCPNCNELLVERSFNGPMGARFSGRYAQVFLPVLLLSWIQGSGFHTSSRSHGWRPI